MGLKRKRTIETTNIKIDISDMIYIIKLFVSKHYNDNKYILLNNELNYLIYDINIIKNNVNIDILLTNEFIQKLYEDNLYNKIDDSFFITLVSLYKEINDYLWNLPLSCFN